LKAITIVLIGHAAGVSFGAVGTPVFSQVALTGLDAVAIAGSTALLHTVLAPILLIFVVRLAREEPDGTVTAGASWLWAVLAGVCFLVPFYLIAVTIGPELPSLGGALIGGLVFILILRWRRPASSIEESEGDARQGAALLRAGLPYLVLLALILLTRLIGPVQEALSGYAWQWQLFGEFGGSFQPLYHPGTMLFLGFLIGGALQGGGAGRLTSAMASAGKRLVPVVIALIAMLGLSRLMVHAGMISTLAEAAAATFGPVWPVLTPAIGMLGSFVTGSATASNILFTDFQEETVQALGLSVLLATAAQGFGAAVGNIVCPHNVVAGAATVGLQGREGEVLRHTLLAGACYALGGGVLVYLLMVWI
jgi:lactate permease